MDVFTKLVGRSVGKHKVFGNGPLDFQ